jgi:aromatic ring-opening dioxygenase catalytic subunit (LigB family)
MGWAGIGSPRSSSGETESASTLSEGAKGYRSAGKGANDGRRSMEPYDWAVRFESVARDLMWTGEHGPLVAYESLGRDALRSVTTPDHYLPLLYVLGLREPEEAVSYPVEGFDGGSISMLSVRFG